MLAASTLLVTQNFPPAIGGSCTLFSNLYRRYPAGSLGVLTSRRGDAREFDGAFRHPVLRRDFAPRSWTKPFEWVDVGLRQLTPFRQWGRNRRVQSVHCGSTFPEGVAGLAAKLLHRSRLVVWVHGEDVEQFRRCRVEGPLQRLMLRRADRVVANSRNSARICRELGVAADRVAVVHPGVDLDKFRPDPAGAAEVRRRYGLGGRRLLATVGRLQLRKGQDKVIEALPTILRAMPDVAYLVVGDSSGCDPADAERLRRLTRELGLEDVVRFTGAVPGSELAAHYSAADLFVMPNREIDGDIEGFGQTFLEAAACGKASVAGDSGGAKEAVVHERTGLVVDGGSAACVAGAILRLLSDDALRTRLEVEARSRSDDFGWDRVYERFRAAIGE